MSEIATLKGMKCPQCGSEELLVRGKPGGAGKAIGGALTLGRSASSPESNLMRRESHEML